MFSSEISNMRPRSLYRGRFAPSPSGLLHFGSLIAALASFLQAKSQQGTWLVRIEDIDPPRAMPGADKAILTTLEAYGLHWDEDVLFQSQQHSLYLDTLSSLSKQELSYFCQCTRANIKTMGGFYDGTCRDLNLSGDNCAVRLRNTRPVNQFVDLIQGNIKAESTLSHEDFIIHRKDGLFAYQLAVVVDDIYQGITEVVRGCDLLEVTVRQITLLNTLGATQPAYLHVPLAITSGGYKLSKQNSAPALNDKKPQETLLKALTFLGQKPTNELMYESVETIIKWAISHWDMEKIPKNREIIF